MERMRTSATSEGSVGKLRPRVQPSPTAFRRSVRADSPEAIVRLWDGTSKAFPTRTAYAVGFGALTALSAMIAVIAFGFDAAVIVIVLFGLGLPALVTFMSPPAVCERVPAREIRVGDFVTSGDDDFVIRAAPVTAVTVAQRGARDVVQVATASGSAYEVDWTGSLPTVRLVGFAPRIPVSAMSAADAQALGARAREESADNSWPWSDLVAGLVARLLQHQRAEGPTPTRDQVRADLVACTRSTQATARYALLAATGLGFVTHGRFVTVTPAGAVWSASRTYGIGSRIENPLWVAPSTPVPHPVPLVADVSASRGPVVDLSLGRSGTTAAVRGNEQI